MPHASIRKTENSSCMANSTAHEQPKSRKGKKSRVLQGRGISVGLAKTRTAPGKATAALLMPGSNLVGYWTGRSLGFAPRETCRQNRRRLGISTRRGVARDALSSHSG
jgi:hypothetical protein